MNESEMLFIMLHMRQIKNFIESGPYTCFKDFVVKSKETEYITKEGRLFQYESNRLYLERWRNMPSVNDHNLYVAIHTFFMWLGKKNWNETKTTILDISIGQRTTTPEVVSDIVSANFCNVLNEIFQKSCVNTTVNNRLSNEDQKASEQIFELLKKLWACCESDNKLTWDDEARNIYNLLTYMRIVRNLQIHDGLYLPSVCSEHALFYVYGYITLIYYLINKRKIQINENEYDIWIKIKKAEGQEWELNPVPSKTEGNNVWLKPYNEYKLISKSGTERIETAFIPDVSYQGATVELPNSFRRSDSFTVRLLQSSQNRTAGKSTNDGLRAIEEKICGIEKDINDTLKNGTQDISTIIDKRYEAIVSLLKIRAAAVSKEEYATIVAREVKNCMKGNANSIPEDKIIELLEYVNNGISQTKAWQDAVEEWQNYVTKRLKEINDTAEDTNKGVHYILNIIKYGLRSVLISLPIVATVGLALWIAATTGTNISFLRHRTLFFALPLVCVLVIGIGILVFLISKKKLEDFLPDRKWRWVAISCWALPLVVWGVFFISLPYKSADTFMEEFEWKSVNNKQYDKIVGFMETYMENHPKSEDVRVRLAEYYLYYAFDFDKAVEVTKPMSDPQEYKQGAIMYAIAAYKNGDYSRTQGIVDKFNDENMPIEIMGLKGMMQIYGIGYTRNEENAKEGIGLLEKAVQLGDVNAMYYLGYIYAHDLSESWNTDKRDKGFDVATKLPIAVKMFKEASELAKANLELGNLYADLNVNDSAVVYYEKALEKLPQDREKYLEAKFGLGMVKNRMEKGSGDRDMQYAVDRDYIPSIIYYGDNEEDAKKVITLYKERMPVYKGCRYISPLALAYIKMGQKNEALKALQESRPQGHFNIDFVEGLTSLLGTQYIPRDSVRGMGFMEKSAKQGCLYAEMLCLYREMERKKTCEDGGKTLIEIGDSIPFAYVLMSNLCDRFGGEKGKEQSERFASFAINKKCYSAADLLLNIAYNDATPTFNQRSYAEKALRYASDKRNLIVLSYYYDVQNMLHINGQHGRMLYHYDVNVNDFWADVAIANHCWKIYPRLIQEKIISESSPYDAIKIQEVIREKHSIRLLESYFRESVNYPESVNEKDLESSATFIKAIMGSNQYSDFEREFSSNSVFQKAKKIIERKGQENNLMSMSIYGSGNDFLYYKKRVYYSDKDIIYESGNFGDYYSTLVQE